MFQLLDLIDCLHLIIHFSKTERVCALLLKKWAIVLEMERTLKILYDATIAMQNEKHTLSDFYADWVLANIKLEKLAKKSNKSNIAKRLLESLKSRKSQLFDKPLMICAIALDPRFCSVLNEDQKDQAKDEFKKLYQRLEAMDQRKNSSDKTLVGNSCADHDSSISDETLLEEFVFGKTTQSEKLPTGSSQDIGDELETFIAAQKGFPKESTIHFHINNQTQYPKLFKLAMVVFAVAPTQVVVERAFSVLSYVFNVLRNQLKSSLLADILVICLNEDLFHIVNDEDMRGINIFKNEA